MAADVTFFLVAYDIPDDQRRTHVAKELLNFGDRVQDSVFECHLSPARRELLEQRLRRLLVPDEDLCRLYQLCAECVPKIRNLGLGSGTSAPPDLLVI